MKNTPHKTKTVVMLSILLLSTGTASDIVPKGVDIGVLQFDGIIEINAPHFQTHVLLFVRYWVSPKYYSVSVVWAEPHVGGLNFPIYPATTVIDSNEKNFRINNEVNTVCNSTFSKPLGKRGVFQYMFNDYPIGNIRFAESDTLETRIYANDLTQLSEHNDNDWQQIEISKSENKNGVHREAAKINLQINAGRIDTLKLLDEKDRLIKSIEYEYSTQNSPYHLLRQNVLLPERPITVGYKSGGVTITINDSKSTIQELETFHHAGSRKCIVNYETKNIAGKTLALPVHVSVVTLDGQKVLRSSRLFNFKRVDMNSEQVRKSAEAFSSFDGQDWKCREMLLKYWTKDPSEVEDEDLKTIRQLRTHFEKISTIDKTAGEQLRRVNMLLQIDWMLGDGEQLKKHFQQYLDILIANDLERMVLVGGQYAIETTIRWGQFSAANEILENWIDAAVAANDEEAILNFGESVIMKNRFWTVARLFEKSLSLSEKWGQKRFNAESLRCIALHKLYESLKNIDKIKKGLSVNQANWVSSSTGIDKLQGTLNESIANAKKTFANLAEPTQEQKVLRAQIEKIQTLESY